MEINVSTFFKSFLIIIPLLISSKAHSQLIRFSENVETFPAEMKTVMATGENSFAIALGETFVEQFQTKYTSEQQKILVATSLDMAKRGHKMPQYYLYLRLLDFKLTEEGTSAQNFTDLLSILQKMVAANPMQKASKNFEDLNEFFRTRIIYKSNYNTLYAVNGSYKLRFEENSVQYFDPAKPAEVTKADAPKGNEDFGLFDDWDREETDDDWSDSPSSIELEILKKNIQLPTAVGLLTDLKNVDLVIVTQSDSVVLRNTTGGIVWQTGKFIGKGGKFTWENVGLPQIVAEVKEYSLDVMNPRFSAEDVALTYPDRLTAPINGVFEFRAGKRPAGVMNSYPRFKSYEANANIKNIEQYVDYKGGFSLMGNVILSSSLADKFSEIVVRKPNEYHFKAISRKFVLNDSLITADRASFVAYLEGDSISHPGVQLKYNSKERSVKLNKLENGLFQSSSYNDTFHQMNIRCDAVRWDLATQKMDFYIVAGKAQVPVLFESFNFFNPKRVQDLSGMAGFNPLLLVNNYVRKTQDFEFTVEEIAKSVGRPAQQFQGGLMSTVQQGLLSYNPVRKTFKLTTKGIHYIRAFAGQKDYDDLLIPSFFQSNDSTANGTLDLKSKDLTIRGTQRFSLSDELGIYVIPYDNILQFKKNRTFAFDGQLIVKNYRFAGKGLEIDYDNFSVKLTKIDSISFIPIAIYEKGGKVEIGSHVKFEHSGVVYLNRPDNKSGKMNLPEYPRLVMEKGVIVFFDKNDRKGGQFNRDVYFDIPKIDHDSLNVKDLEFVGTFHSDNILKPFQEKLVVMPDITLGFSHKVPNGSYEVYGSKLSSMAFASALIMDGKGLHSSGKINHLAAALDASNVNFFSDSLIAVGEIGEIKETVNTQMAYFPQVAVNNYSLKWIPDADSMLIASKKGFDFYEGTSTLTGKLLVRTGGLFGLGVLARTDSEMQSDNFKFDKPGFQANQSVFKIKSAVASAKPVLLGENVNVNFNVINSLVEIAMNEQGFNDSTKASLEFPSAAYRTNIGRAKWDIDKKTISMQGNVENTTFSSTNDGQLGLAFNGSAAQYDIVGMTLNIDGVPFITSADARIIPDKGKVVIQRNAAMQPFVNAGLTIDTLNGYHNLINGNIRILSKKKFTGDATYQFVNVSSDTFNIKMGNFELKDLLLNKQSRNKDALLSTVANAKVRVGDSLFLSPKMLYKGDISMLAPQKNLSLDGFVIPELKKYPQLGGNWITYQGDKSEEITINVNEQLISGDSRIYAGLHVKANSGTNGLYPTFLSVKKSPEDDDIFTANGTFRRDEPNKRFVIYPEENSRESSRYELIDNEGIIRTEGKFNMLGGEISKYIDAAGFAEVNLDSNDYAFDMMMLYEFPLSQQLAASMANTIIKTNLDEGNNESAIPFESEEFMSKLTQFVSEKDAKTYRDQLYKQHLPMFKFSPKFATTIVLSDLKMKWNPEINSFYSVGKIGVSNIGESDVNAMISGYLEIKKNPLAGDEVYLFLEVSGENWYYLGYKDGEMGVVSSDDSFNKLIAKKDKGAKNKDYKVISIDFAEPITFRRRFLATYRGLDDESFGKKPVNPKKLVLTPEQKEKKEEKKKATEVEGF
ncbi:MAG: hypothetical protein ACI9V1_001685 [Spirosomataceae bacterium]|jgi:hypothetical protein